MKNKRLLLVVVLGLCAGAARAYDDGDWQFWNTDTVELKLNDQWKTSAQGEFYFGDDMSEWYYRHIDVGAFYKACRFLSLGASFRYLEEKKNGEWLHEYRPHACATLSGKAWGFKADMRNRIEYRDKEEGTDGWRYRNRVRVRLPFAWTPFKITPYVCDECFVDLNGRELNQNRIGGGLTSSLAPSLKLNVYYLAKHDKKTDGWKLTHVLGMGLDLQF